MRIDKDGMSFPGMQHFFGALQKNNIRHQFCTSAFFDIHFYLFERIR